MILGTPPLSLGFIGGGLSSAVGKTHFNASRMDGRWRLEAGVFSRNPAINRETARQWNVDADRLYPTWMDLIKNEAGKLDAVVILTPTPDHVDELCALMDANIPVICEKALVCSLDEVRRVHRHYDPKRHFLAVTYNYSGYPMVRELRERIRLGDIGEIQHLRFEMPQEGFARQFDGKVVVPQNWRLVDGSIPTICLDLGTHLHHLAHFTTGTEPSEVFARFANYSQFREIIDNGDILLNYNNGITANFSFSKTEFGHRNGLRIRIYGDKGGAEWVQMNPEELTVALADGTRLTLDRGGPNKIAGQPRYTRMKAGHPAGFVEAFANLYVDIADSLRAYKQGEDWSNPYVYGLDHAAYGLRVLRAATVSHKTRRWQDLATFDTGQPGEPGGAKGERV